MQLGMIAQSLLEVRSNGGMYARIPWRVHDLACCLPSFSGPG